MWKRTKKERLKTFSMKKNWLLFQNNHYRQESVELKEWLLYFYYCFIVLNKMSPSISFNARFLLPSSLHSTFVLFTFFQQFPFVYFSHFTLSFCIDLLLFFSTIYCVREAGRKRVEPIHSCKCQVRCVSTLDKLFTGNFHPRLVMFIATSKWLVIFFFFLQQPSFYILFFSLPLISPVFSHEKHLSFNIARDLVK